MPVGTPPMITINLSDGASLRVRPIARADQNRIATGFEGLSEVARYQRFFTSVTRLSNSQLEYLTDIDHVNHFAWGVETLDGIGVAIARYVRTGDDVAEAAFTIIDDFQGRGLGWTLLQALAMVGSVHSFERFEMTMLADNAAMARLAKKAGARFDPPTDGTMRAEVALDPEIWLDLGNRDELQELATGAAQAA